jgi:5-methylthioribose kinase
MTYQALNTQTVVDYLKGRPALARILDLKAHLVAAEVGDGNLNQVFIVKNADDPSQTCVVKQALPYLRYAGESWPLTRDRIISETEALLLYNQIAPGLSPEIYDHDYDMSLVVMRYLGDMEVMRKPLVARKRFPLFVDHISTFMANTLFFTSDLYLTSAKKKEMQKKFVNPELSRLQEDFVYGHPYFESPDNAWNPLLDAEVKAVRRNGPLKVAIAEMKESYMTHAQALIHADLHTGSIMLNARETMVIDPEFCFYGPSGYDVAAVLQNLVHNYLSHYAHTPESVVRADYQAYLLDTIRRIWIEFARKFDAVWKDNNCGELQETAYWQFSGGDLAFADFRRRYLEAMWRDVVGHGGVKLLRRTMGIVTVWDISSIGDMAKRAVCERPAIRIGSRWLLERDSIKSVDDLIGVVREETKDITV